MPNTTDCRVLEVSVLGPISIDKLPPFPTDDSEVARRRRIVIDFVVYLALNGGQTTETIDEEFFRNARQPSQVRWNVAAMARHWLGRDRLPRTTRDGVVRLAGVTTDWARFGLYHQRGEDDLALRLVRGQPLTGLSRHVSGWADMWQAQMIAVIHQTGISYGREHLHRENWTEARIGIKAALSVEPASIPAYGLADALARKTDDAVALERSRDAKEQARGALHDPRYV
ncbi:hypothetical protein [Solicola gregarius]|uniref:Uncharacterized protein n=1 Tax=Solicola gregarius TaxID=2908642 RepID=A0AA46TJ60_9ACTN|nr:hypothetical protein [Solicola gregarius]UYM06324.1 hypothetical protein L0C25_04390 [Solicola gregarius]